jgi:uncharacterized repeat protein (TIGR03803 family)
MHNLTELAGSGAASGPLTTPPIPGQRRVSQLLALVFAAWLSQSETCAQAAQRQALKGHVPLAVGHLQSLGRLAGTNHLNLVIGLPLRNRESLTGLLGQIYDPASPYYHQYLTPADFADRFGPTPQDYEAVMAFAKANGLRVTGTHANRTLVNVSGAAGDIERTFQVKLYTYQHPTEGRTFYAPDAEPSVDLAVPVLTISGLDNYELPHPAGRSAFPIRKLSEIPPSPESLATGGGPRGSFIGRDFRAAYAPGVSLDGAGEAVGLLEFDGYYPGDVFAYENLAGLPNVPLTNVPVGGFSGQPGGNNVEVALDIDMAISMAPGLSKIIVYEAVSGGNPIDLLNRMATDTNGLGQPATRQLSSSWSWSGSSSAAQDQVFQQFAAQGQSFFQASGDIGAYCATCPPPWPSANPYITIVGGTALTTSNPGGSWSSESVWSFGGGGVSPNYPIPSWQQGVEMTGNGGSTARRNVPDVACLADAVIWIVANNGEQAITGGTSASAPLWAGFTALANQQAAASGKPGVGFINPAIYAIGRSSSYASAFHDITTGNNANGCCGTASFFAAPGYDLATGWGTPNGSNLISALLTPPVPLRITPTTSLAFTGPFGGPFRPAAQGYTLTNDSNAPLSWTLANAAAWLSVTPSGGNLTNGGPAGTVTVTLTAAANSLPVGGYSATLWFTNVNLTNLNERLGQSRQVTLDIVAPPMIIAQPANQSVLQGMTASFTVGTANSASASYQWQYDNGLEVIDVADDTDVSGSKTSTLVIRNTAPEDAGAYSVIVSNAAGTVSSVEAFLAVFPWRPVITAQPVDQTVLGGQAVTFTVEAVGKEPLFYRWQRNSSNLSDGGNLSGAASSSLTLHSASLADAGTYSVVVSNADGVAASSGALLTVVAITGPGTSLTTAYSFTGGTDGANPNALLRVVNGSFYGTTQHGGTNLAGTVFQMTAGGAVTDLYSFTGGDDGATPFAALAQGPDGNFYGTAFQGGAYDNGTVFRVTSSGVLSNLISLNITNGDLPYAGLTLGDDLNFYGTTYQGGAGSRGTAFRVSTNGSLTALYSFNNGLAGGFLAAGLLRGSDGSFYGTTYKGGAYGYGTVFRIAADGALTTLAAFDQTNGAYPLAELVQDAAGTLYGTTTSGGAYTNGAVFRLDSAGVLSRLYSFGGSSDGGFPAAGLLQGSDGNFYGTTAYGGAYGFGTAFRLAPDGALTTLAAFDGYAGANPQAALVENADRSLVGTTQNGGASNAGVIFRLSFSGAPQITTQPASQSVYSGESARFSVAVFGASPLSYRWQKNGTNLVDGDNISGSTNRILNFSRVTTNDVGNYSVLVSNAVGSTNSAGGFLQVLTGPPLLTSQPASQAVFVGESLTFSVGVTGPKPVFYQWRRNGTNLVEGGNLSGSTNGTLALTNVALADAGTYSLQVRNEFGSTNSADASLVVTSSPPIIVLAPTNLTLHPGDTAIFTVVADGNKPLCLQWQHGNGLSVTNLAAAVCSLSGSLSNTLTLTNVTEADSGTNTVVVSNGLGSTNVPAVLTVVPVSAAGTRLVTLHWFSSTSGGGGWPPNGLVCATNGDLYGTTQFGRAGSPSGLGTAFRLTTNGVLTTLVSFSGASGSVPQAALAQGNDGNLYGTTKFGGTNFVGNVFQMTPEGGLTNLYSFTDGADGSYPVAPLLPATDGDLYGTTPAGGDYAYGNVFRITPTGAFTNLYSFTGGIDGNGPTGALVQGADGNFYGLTPYGGAYGKGNAFSITPGGVLTTIYSFTGGRDGNTPAGALVEGPDFNLYGATTLGGLGNAGTAFKLTLNGVLTTLHSFGDFVNKDGLHPGAGLVQSIDGNLYGTTASDLVKGYGTVFRVAADGSTFATLAYFDGFDGGATPAAALVEDANGDLYGTTSKNGLSGRGTVFKLSFVGPPQVTSQPAAQGLPVGGNVTLSVAETGARPFTYQWLKNGTNLLDGGNLSGSTNRILHVANASLTDAGTYSVIVSNALGSATSAGARVAVVYPPVFLSAVRSNCTLTLTWSAVPGQRYRLQSNPTLAASDWTFQGGFITANSSVTTASDNVCTNARKFYRVILFP